MNQSAIPGKDRANNIPWPPILTLSSLGISILLTWYLPLPWLDGGAGGLIQAFGALLIGVAVLLYVTSIREFRRVKTTVNPMGTASHLITGGPFRFSRNPIYLANVVLLIGLGAMFGAIWFFPMAILNGIAEHRLAVVREEAHLEHMFGKAWREYKKRVRAWI
jgi:protein-S-isoprenylcysteine O-methyltransferase Ste14